MSLKFFHIFFIFLCLLFGIFLIYLSQLTPNRLIFFTGVFLILSLVPYSLWFFKKIKTLALLLSGLFLSKMLEACPMCYSDNSAASQQTIEATKTGIIFLGTVIIFVLGIIAFTGFTWAKRSKYLQET